MIKALKWLLLGAAGVYLAALLFVYVTQRSYIYFPNTAAPAADFEARTGTQIVKIPVDGIGVLNSVYIAPPPGAPVILYIHGNGRSVYDRTPQLADFKAWGVGALAVEYPGYGGNVGSPSESAIFQTSLSNYDWLIAQGVSAADIVIYGNSLGSASAVYVAANRDAAGLILTAPFKSALAMAQSQMPFFPSSILMKDKFRSDLRIKEVEEPLLVIHGTDDEVVPFEMGEALARLHTGVYDFVTIEGGRHYMWNTKVPERIRAAVFKFTER